MNNYASRGFGGPPQPQRQGGRRGNRGGIGGFRGNSRFDHNQPRSQSNQNGQQEGQRPSENKPAQQPVKPQQAAPSPQPQAQAKPAAQTPAQKTPTPQNATPAKIDTPQAAQQAKPQQQQQQPKPGQTPIKTPSQDSVDKAAPEAKKAAPESRVNQNQQQQQQQTNFNGTYGGNKVTGWTPVNKSGGQGNKTGGGLGEFTPVQGGNKGAGLGEFTPVQGGNKTGGGLGNFTPVHENQGNKPGGLGNFNKVQGNKPGGLGNFNQSQENQANKPGGMGSFNHGQENQGKGPGGLGNFQQGQGHQGKPGGQNNFNQGPPNQGFKSGGQGHFNNQFGQKQGGMGGGRQSFGGPGGPGGPGGQRGPMRGRGPPPEEQMLAMKLKDLVGPLIDLPPIDNSEVKFNGRSRLYIGNLTNDVSEDEIMNMFSEFGEAAELFLNKEKNFGFIKMDYRVNAERAKRELDGKVRNGRSLRVRFAPHNAAVRVKNLPPFVTNELLYRAFEIFGKIERAYVRVDERGKSLGEGVVEYVRKPSALAAIRNCTEKCFFLTSSLRPVIVESFEEPDELDGFPEKNLPKKHPDFYKAREIGPRFSELNSFEHEYGTRWKQLHELHRQKEEALKKELASEEEKLEAQMEYAKYEHETELLREQLRQREQDRDRQKRSWEMAERAADERREAERASLLRQEEELASRMRLQDDELRRRQQENTLFVQAQRLNTMLDRQEQGIFDQQKPLDGGFREQYDMGRGYDELQSRWEGPRALDDFPSKRRRF